MTITGKILHIVFKDDLKELLSKDSLNLIQVKVLENQKLCLLMETESSYLTIEIDKKDFDEFFYTMEIVHIYPKPY